MTAFKWSQTAASNATADATVNWAEGQAPSSVNNSARAMMAALAKLRDDISGSLLTEGSSTAYTVTSNQVYTSYIDGATFVARLHEDSGAAPTLNVDALGAKAIHTHDSVAPVAGAMKGGGTYRFTYSSDDDCFYVSGFYFYQEFAPTTKMVFWQTAAPTGWTKDTNHGDKALRITSGAASTGGTVAFETAFASKSVVGTIGGTAITVAQMPLHGHPMWISESSANDSDPTGGIMLSTSADSAFPAFTGTPSETAGRQIGGTGGGATHDHSFTGTAINLDVAFVDVILATKD